MKNIKARGHDGKICFISKKKFSKMIVEDGDCFELSPYVDCDDCPFMRSGHCPGDSTKSLQLAKDYLAERRDRKRIAKSEETIENVLKESKATSTVSVQFTLTKEVTDQLVADWDTDDYPTSEIRGIVLYAFATGNDEQTQERDFKTITAKVEEDNIMTLVKYIPFKAGEKE